MKDPNRCNHPACGAWTFRADGYCSDSCSGTMLVTAASLRGIGIVSPPTVAHATKRARVKRNTGYIASNGAWIATAEAPYGELQGDVRTLERKQRTYNARVARLSGKIPRDTRTAAPRATRPVQDAAHRITAADLAPIGDQNH